MLKIEFNYNGRNYNSISDVMQKAMVDGIRENITNALKPFESEIIQSGGNVQVNIPENMQNMDLQLNNMPQDLIDRITKALNANN
jgi:hypothetical protein